MNRIGTFEYGLKDFLNFGIETDEITKSSIVYSRDELLALYVPSVGELELPKEMPVLSKSSLVPHIFQKFDFEEVSL